MSPSSGVAGASVTVSFMIRNQGSGTASASTTNIRLNTSSSSVTISDPLLVSISTPSIAAGGTSNVSQAVTIPSNRSPGQHYVWVILDVSSTAGQGAANEANDKTNTPFTVTGLPDLITQSLAVSPSSGVAGASVTVSFTIRNQGSGTASASTTNIRLNTSSSSVTISDPLLATVSTPSIGAGGTVNVSQTVTIPGVSAGSYFVWVILDVSSTAGQGATNEANDKSNTPFTVTGSGNQSDLVIQNLVVSPSSGVAGASVTASFTIRNQGSGTANASTTNIRLATSSTNVTTSDPLLATVSTPSLAQGETQNVSRSVTIPNVSVGNYFVWMIADVNSTANQSNEQNDRVNTPFTVTSVALQSDLSIENLVVSPSSGAAGASVTVSFTVRNQGSGTANASTTNIRLSSSNSNVTDNDPPLASISTPSISQGETQNVSRSVTVPSVSPGGYFVWVIADVNRTAGQSNEQNDKVNMPFTVVQPSAGPDLAVCTPDRPVCTGVHTIKAYSVANSSKLEAGEDSTVEFVIQNVGDQASQLGIYLVNVKVWDVNNSPESLDTPVARQQGRAKIQDDSFHVLMPFLAPGEMTTIRIPQDSIDVDAPPNYIFSSSAYSDQLEVNFLPPYSGAFDPDVDRSNNSGFVNIRPALSVNDAFRCLGGIGVLASGAIFATGGAPAAIGIAAAYGVSTTSLRFIYDIRDASRDPHLTKSEIFEVMGRAYWGLAKTTWSLVSNGFIGNLKISDYMKTTLALTLDAEQAWDAIGCTTVFPETRLLFQAMARGVWKKAHELGDSVFGFFGGSPVDFLIIDSSGRQLVLRPDGTVDSSIPDAAAVRIEGIALNLITLPAGDAYTFQVRGLEVGSAEVGIVQGKNDGSVVTVAYGEIAQQPGSSASVDINSSTTDYLLQIDADGNNTIDESLAPDSIDILSPPVVPLLGFSTASLPQAEVGIPYSFKLDVAGGEPPYRFTLVSGSLPDGLGLVETGEIVGTPTTGAEATFTVKVEDLVGNFVTAELRLTVDSLTFTLTVTKEGTGSGTVTSDPVGIDCGGTCQASFDSNTGVTLTAIPDAGSVFAGWGGACAGMGNCMVSMTGDQSVTASFTLTCGNGIVESGEQCDPGADILGDCCTAACTLVSVGTECRASAGACDVAESCTGSSAACPVDAKSTAECRPGVGACDVVESCNGVSTTCPADGFASSSTVCRAEAGECDQAESCNGSSPSCPADALKPASTACSDDGTVCTTDICNGSSATCTHSAGNAGTVCRAAAGACDVAENCTGTSTTCPADGFATSSRECRAAAGECDLAESCNGSSPSCPADTLKPASTACSDDGTVCTADICNGSSATCTHPAGNAGTVCRAAAGACDVAESCSGTNTTCPADAKSPAGTLCPDDGSSCTNDMCDGSGACTHPDKPVVCGDGAVCGAEVCDPPGLQDGCASGAVCNTTCSACVNPTTITVLSPNGGETWPIPSSQTIRWSSSGITGNVKIELSRNAGSKWTTLFSSTANDGTQPWTITLPATTQAQIRICSVSSPSICDTSNENFRLGGGLIVVSNPTGGAAWPIGSKQTIQWTSTGVGGNVKVELSRNGGTTWTTLFGSTANDGSQSWVVTGLKTTQARLRVSSVNDPSVFDIENFTLGGGMVTVNTPNGGEVWPIGGQQTIRWSTSWAGGTVKIDVSRNGGASWATLFNGTANDGTAQWTVTGLPTTQARIRVSNASDLSVFDISNVNFTIR
ncbi:MAG: hypothetical protein HYZ50_01915 [Deltaproteobacteria bacterium]|nr:hypothetical protein [Deltaproteobacteria bacterium]